MTTFSSLITQGCFRPLWLYLCWCLCLEAYAQDASGDFRSSFSAFPTFPIYPKRVLHGALWKYLWPPLDLFYISDFLYEIMNFIKTTMFLTQNYQQLIVSSTWHPDSINVCWMNETINCRTSSFYSIATRHQINSLKRYPCQTGLISFSPRNWLAYFTPVFVLDQWVCVKDYTHSPGIFFIWDGITKFIIKYNNHTIYFRLFAI